MSIEKRNDSDWTAFQYAAGELTDRQRADFEATLKVDETAQQSLTQTVGLLIAIRAARPAEFRILPGGSARPERRSRRSLLWLSGCLAASAAALVAGWFALPSLVSQWEVSRNERGIEDPVQLAIIWNETRSTLQTQEEWSPDEQAVTTAATSWEPVVPEEYPDTWSISETPPWVWAAVGADLAGADQEQVEDDPANLGEI